MSSYSSSGSPKQPFFSKARTALLVGGLLLDQVSKWIANNHLSFFKGKVIIPNILEFQLVHNYGAAYGILQNQRIFLCTVSLVVIIGCILFRDKIATTKVAQYGVIFLLIGSMGNCIDRLLFGYVIDFINIHIFPVFNVADMAIDIGILCLLYDTFWPPKEQQSDHEKS